MQKKDFVHARRFIFFLLIIFLCVSTTPGHGADLLSPGMKLPEFRLSPPTSKDARRYLGLTNTAPFFLSQIPAKLILVEVLSVFCQYCQKQAPDVNRIYQYIQDDPKLSKDIKMIGIVAIGDQKAVDAFKTAYRVKFPLIPDPKMDIFTKLQKPPIPFLLLVNKKRDILLTHSGYLKNADEFYGEMKKIAGNQK